jgi:hypothetical protein
LAFDAAELKSETRVQASEHAKLHINLETTQKRTIELKTQNRPLLSRISVENSFTGRCSRLTKELHQMRDNAIAPPTAKAE